MKEKVGSYKAHMNNQSLKEFVREKNMTENKKPDWSIKEGRFNIACWKGEKYDSLKLTRSWKREGEEQWNTESMNVFPSEIPKLISVLSQTVDKLALDENKN